MIINVTMKYPDALDDGIWPVLKEKFPGKTRSDLADDYDEVYGICSKWVRGGEYVTIQIDTEAVTAIVLPAKR